MKTFCIASLLIALYSTSVFSQEKEAEPQNLFSAGTSVTGWFAGLHNSYTSLNERYTFMPGFSAGVVMNRNFMLGIAARSLSWYPESMQYTGIFNEAVYLEGGFGGLYAEPGFFSKNLVHITFPVIMGGGQCLYRTVEEYPEVEDEGEIDYSNKTLSRSPFFVVEPGINLELNVTGFLRLSAGYSYRIMSGLSLWNTSRTAFNYSNFNIGIKIGKF